ncbi:cytochrome b561 and DOMON domain-containing protein At3g07570-like [Silene latifolia]|uniref:cytochrome b561 and DOMON domain-containing protein At3g07570-like n=1 Tax=Silene latifolia TaxID=37657 RepID=UPI003D774BA2
MKGGAFFILAIFLLHSSFLVHSQYLDSCDNNVINFNEYTSFDTTAMACQVVWEKESFTLRYAKAGIGLWSFLLSAYNRNSWIAMAFSTNNEMIGSSAMVGWMYLNGTSKVLQYDLKGKDSKSVLPDKGNLTVIANSSSLFVQSDRMYMAFQLSTPQPLTNLLYAIGPFILPTENDGLKLSMHRTYISTTMDFETGLSHTQASPFTGLRKTHGALNMIGWGIFMPIGAIVARYFRHLDPVWFYTHTTVQILGFLFGVVGFMLGFVVEGFIKAEVTYHKNIGITILIISCFQVLALLVRPQKKMKIRKYWNWYHHNAGRILIVLIISNIFYGVRLGMEGPSWYGTYAAIVAIMFVTAIVLEVRLRRQR